VLQQVVEAYGCSLVEGVLSHQLKQFVIDGNKCILNKVPAPCPLRALHARQKERARVLGGQAPSGAAGAPAEFEGHAGWIAHIRQALCNVRRRRGRRTCPAGAQHAQPVGSSCSPWVPKHAPAAPMRPACAAAGHAGDARGRPGV
jgi:hypothetical protein